MGKLLKAFWDPYVTRAPRGLLIPQFPYFRIGILRSDPAIRADEWFAPRNLMDHCSNLGLVIDLTNTNRYYEPYVFESQGIKHKKIKTEGHVVPKKQHVYNFMKTVDGFLEENKENDKLIGVHCTHGINRTGYMICRYMIQRLEIPADQAISDFDSARGHKQERDNYLQDLREATWINEDPYKETENDVEEGSDERQQRHDGDGDRNEDEGRTGDNCYSNGYEDESNSTPGHTNGYFRRDNGTDSDFSTLGPVRRWSNSPRFSPRSGGRGSPYGNGWRGDNRRGDGRGGRGSRRGRFSPTAARMYYNNHYHGQPSQQYDPHFYERRDAGSGIGPHRPSTRRDVHFRENGNNQIGPHRHRNRNDHQTPRQYQGRRNYKSPPRFQQEDSSKLLSPPSDLPKTPGFPKTPALPPMDGPSRHPLSPGVRPGIFSPEENNTPRIGTSTPGFGATLGTPSIGATPGFVATPGLPKTPDFLSTPRIGTNRYDGDGTPKTGGECTPRRRPQRWAPY
ncbi:unnamed protein product, partial [Meganyctiphanes norvegica]